MVRWETMFETVSIGWNSASTKREGGGEHDGQVEPRGIR